MPYISDEKRPALDKDYMNARDAGDLAYVFSKFFDRVWTKTPRWQTYHNLEKLLVKPGINEEFDTMVGRLSMSVHFDSIDVRLAARLALNEFREVYIVDYEKNKRLLNGGVFSCQDPRPAPVNTAQVS